MTDVVIGSQIIYGKIRLEVQRDHVVDAVTLEGSLITVDIISIFFIDSLNIPVQNLRMKDIIMVKKT